MTDQRPEDTVLNINARDLLESLQNRANGLLAELRAYQAFLQSHQKSNEVEIRIFRRGIESEVKSLKSIRAVQEKSTSQDLQDSSSEDIESKQLHVLRSSNLPFYEAVWQVARKCKGITALGKRFYWNTSLELSTNTNPTLDIISQNGNTKRPTQRKKGVLVDIVAENGLEWIKLSTITEKRLLFEMAKEGWEGYGDYSDSSNSESDNNDRRLTSQKAAKLELVRVAEDLKAASAATRIHYQHPKIKFVLPKIKEGVLDEVDSLFDDLRAQGATVECGHLFEAASPLASPTIEQDRPNNNLFNRLANTLAPLLPSPLISPPLTKTLNIDCTILLALISDISHIPRPELPPSPNNLSRTYHSAILRQVEAEEASPMLPREIYPLLQGDRTLECTQHAAKRMREIAGTMGTKSERTRGEIILGEGPYVNKDPGELRRAFQGLSAHRFPDDLILPIAVIDFEAEIVTKSNDGSDEHSSAGRGSVARRTVSAMNLSPINASVFMYGWSKGVVTVTSNRVVATGIEKTINGILDHDEREGRGYLSQPGHPDIAVAIDGGNGNSDFVGPLIYCCETARSLVGKEKRRY